MNPSPTPEDTMPRMTRAINTRPHAVSRIDEDGWAKIKVFDTRSLKIGTRVRVTIGDERKTLTVKEVGDYWSDTIGGQSGYWCRLA